MQIDYVMARLFSIDIEFQKKYYTALVSLCKQGQDVLCQVRYMDRDLQGIVPGGSLVLSLNDGLSQPASVCGQMAERLVCGTREAIAAYLQQNDHS